MFLGDFRRKLREKIFMAKLNLNKIALLEYLAINQPVKKTYQEIAQAMKFKRRKRTIKYSIVFFKPTRQAVHLIIKELLKERKIKTTKDGYKVIHKVK